MQPLDYSYYTLEQGSEYIPSLFLLKVTCGFSNWKDGTMGFRSQGNGATHNKAVEVMVTFPATTRDIGEQLSSQHAPQKVKNSEALLQIMSCIRFLSRQGLAMRGDGDESDANLQQLLCMKAADNPNLADWLKRKENVYTSPDIQMKS